MDRLVDRTAVQADDQSRHRFLQSLKYPDFNARRNQVLEAYSDTWNWIFPGKVEELSDYAFLSAIKWDSFSDWLSSSDSIYWISGKPGSGKTTLFKYILEDQRTREHLDIWSRDCKIVSHYFWRPGSRMQKNLEGLYFSLLYQLLESNAMALGDVMSIVGPKDSHTDWSSAELKSVLLRTLDFRENGVCMFLDGIDEIAPEDGTKDGIPEFLDLISKLAQRGKTKLCLASRPDPPILEMRLCEYPRLRLQDLNYQDLTVYARGHVNLPKTDELNYHIRSLVSKAQGVFLWLILATKSINEGVDNGDDYKFLQERIDRLPEDLDSLYQDMWERGSAKSPRGYRQTAALYFKLLLAWQIFSPAGRDFSMLELMLATTSIGDKVTSNSSGEPLNPTLQDDMLQNCSEVEKKLDIYCFGLVEVVPEPTRYYMRMSWYERKYNRAIAVALTRRLQFIHRTASDFLTDTESGDKILGFDSSSDFTIHYRLMKAWLASLAIGTKPETTGATGWPHTLREFRRTWEGTDEWVAEHWDDLVRIAEKLANLGRLFAGDWHRMTPCVGTDFLKILSCYEVLDVQDMVSRVKRGNLSGNEKSEILLGLCGSLWPGGEGNHDQSRLRAFRELLEAGAEPNWQGWTMRAYEHFFSCAMVQTPWQMYLSQVFHWFLFHRDGNIINYGSTLTSMVKIVCLFISSGATLDDGTHLVLHRNERKSRQIWEWIISSSYTWGYFIDHYKLHVSIPTYTIVKILAETVRNSSALLNEGTFCEEQCQTIERAWTSHRSSKVCRVFAKEEVVYNSGSRTYEWWEANDGGEMHLLASRLMEAIERQIMLSFSVVEGDKDPTARGDAVDEVVQSIADHDAWKLKSQGEKPQSERLEELGLVARIDKTREFHSMEEWIEKHNEEAQTGTTM